MSNILQLSSVPSTVTHRPTVWGPLSTLRANISGKPRVISMENARANIATVSTHSPRQSNVHFSNFKLT